MYNFSYHKPSRLEEAVEILSSTEDAKILAGGQTLIATMKLRLAGPSDLVDLGEIAELKAILKKENNIVIGSMTTHADVAGSEIIKKQIPSLAHLASEIGDQMVRNVGTIGGSVANNDPAADYPAAVLGLGAKVITNTREISGDDFFTGMYETCLLPDEIITSIVFPIPTRSSYIKFKNPASRYAIVGVMVAETHNSVRVAVTGAGSSVFRVKAFEDALGTNFSSNSIANLKVPHDDLTEDMHASSFYRAHLVNIMAQKAVATAK